jgi:creatinine amidohydrolase/Fe(II)-dependent formamide hydrolase-like protein
MPVVTTSGVVGAPSTATADAGAALTEMLVTALAELLAAVRAERDPDLEA